MRVENQHLPRPGYRALRPPAFCKFWRWFGLSALDSESLTCWTDDASESVRTVHRTAIGSLTRSGAVAGLWASKAAAPITGRPEEVRHRQADASMRGRRISDLCSMPCLP